MTRHTKKLQVCSAVVFINLLFAAAVIAAPEKADPFEFVGTVENCGSDGVDTIVGEWRKGIGLADPKGGDSWGLFLVKAGPTTNCAAPGATIKGIKKNSELVSLGFDIRSDSHCGAGAPRFNVVTDDNVLHFLGCAAAAQTPDTPEAGWTRVRMDPAQAFPPIDPNAKILAVEIVFDEGTDAGEGFAILDNILIETDKGGETIIARP
jgi:hypothetical protein